MEGSEYSKHFRNHTQTASCLILASIIYGTGFYNVWNSVMKELISSKKVKILLKFKSKANLFELRQLQHMQRV